MTKNRWLLSNHWPPILILMSVVAACSLVLASQANTARLLAAFWLVTFVPGFAVVRLLKIPEGITNITLSIALSLALSIFVSLLMAYTNTWSLAGGVITLAAVACLASVFEINHTRRRRAVP